MKKRITILSILLFLFIPLAVRAQESVDFSMMEIRLWPEYDRPEMLVIYNIQLSPDVKLPADVTIRIPATAGEPHAVASAQPDGALIYVPGYDLVPAGDWSEISFTTTSPNVRIEYYDTALEKDASARHYQYYWPGDHDVGQMIVSVKQPVDATDMRISPSLGKSEQGEDGLIQYSSDIGSLQRGQDFKITIDYQKETDKLSIAILKVEPSDMIQTTVPSNFSLKSILARFSGLQFSVSIIILGLLGIALLVSGGFLIWKNRQGQWSTKSSRSRRHKPAPQRQQSGAETDYIYCHQCGKRARPGDRFCRACGTQLRTG